MQGQGQGQGQRSCEVEIGRTMEYSMMMEDVVEYVLGKLPLTDLVKASAVCTQWRRIVATSAPVRSQNEARQKLSPWLFLVDAKSGAAVAMDPTTAATSDKPSRYRFAFPPMARASVAASQTGLLYTFCGGRLNYCHVGSAPEPGGARRRWTPPMRWWRLDPLVCHVAGRGVLLACGGAWGTEDDAVDGCVEILRLDDGDDSSVAGGQWEACPPLPACLTRPGSYAALCASDGADRVVVIGKRSGDGDVLCVAFHVGRRRWGRVSALRLYGLRSMSLVGATTRGVLLAALAGPRVLIWRLTEEEEEEEEGRPVEARELCEMPADVAAAVIGCHVADEAWRRVTCVGAGDLLFFHGDRTDVAAVCRLSTLSWSTFHLGCHVGPAPLGDSFTALLCAPVSIGQLVSASSA